MERRISSELEARLRDGADAHAIGCAVGGAWAGIAEALHPVIGVRGVDSLSRRCVVLASAQYPWLSQVADAAGRTIASAQLVEVFARQTPAEAAAGGAELLNTMDALLASLVGASLTGRLLQPVWNDFFRNTGLQGGTA